MPATEKIHIQSLGGTRCKMEMNKDNHTPRRRRIVDYAAAAIEQMKQYCAAHPGSPSAVRLPQLFFRSDLWIALLGPNMEEGIVGIGPTVAAALRAFDAQYLVYLCPPNERTTPREKLRNLSRRNCTASPSAETFRAYKTARPDFE
jgi:hypothetical protein